MTTTIQTNQPTSPRHKAEAALSPDFLLDTAKQFGTPLFVYHAEKIGEQFNKLKEALASVNPTIFYACKALTNINILKYVNRIGCNVDCSSVNEVKLALLAGFEPKRILYTSNNIAFSELEEVAGCGVNINIDSRSNLLKFGKKFGDTYPVGVRLRPNIMAGGNLKISTGHDNSKFGIPLEQVDEILSISAQTGLVVNGLHLHTGSEIKDVEVFIQGVEILFNLSEKFPHLQFLDLGGGFKVKYRPDDHETDIVLLGQRLSEAMAAFQRSSGKKFGLWFEPGKFLVSEAGYLVADVNVIKETRAITFVGMNTGLNHLIRPMFYDAWHTIDNISNPSGAIKEYTITGYICETDTFAANRDVNEIREGDHLVFRNAGAYCFEMSSNYNSRYKPAEVMVEKGEARLIRRAQTMDDLLAGQVL